MVLRNSKVSVNIGKGQVLRVLFVEVRKYFELVLVVVGKEVVLVLVLMVLMVLMLLVLVYHIHISGDRNPEIFVGQKEVDLVLVLMDLLMVVVLLFVVAAQLPQVPHALQ